MTKRSRKRPALYRESGTRLRAPEEGVFRRLLLSFNHNEGLFSKEEDRNKGGTAE